LTRRALEASPQAGAPDLARTLAVVLVAVYGAGNTASIRWEPAIVRSVESHDVSVESHAVFLDVDVILRSRWRRHLVEE
jgi:hypothetical protein